MPKHAAPCYLSPGRAGIDDRLAVRVPCQAPPTHYRTSAFMPHVFPLRVELKVPTFDGHLNQSNTDLRRCSMEYAPRRKLTREFKLEAVRQVALSEKPKAQLARELGVRVGQLRTWRLEFEKEAVTGIAKPDRSAAEDLEQLRRENAKLKMEIEILKKAAIYFAREAK